MSRTTRENLHQLQVFEAGQLLGDDAERVAIQVPGRRNTRSGEEEQFLSRRLYTAGADSTGGDIASGSGDMQW